MSRSSVFISALLALCYISTTLAALALGPAQVDPNQPNFCHHESKSKYYKPGETWTLEGCMQAECVMVSNSTGRPHLMVSYASCGIAAVDPPCYLSENKAAAYPDCCPEPVCPDSAEGIESEEAGSPVGTQQQTSSASSSAASSSSSSSSSTKQGTEDQREVMVEKSSEDSSENEVVHPKMSHTNVLIHPNSRRLLTDFFRSIYPYDDDYLYGDHDHMDNNVDDLQYLDYYPTTVERNPAGASRRFTRHDFNIANFGWY